MRLVRLEQLPEDKTDGARDYSRTKRKFPGMLCEQRDAIGALKDILPNARREGPVAEQPVDHGAGLALRQPVDG